MKIVKTKTIEAKEILEIPNKELPDKALIDFKDRKKLHNEEPPKFFVYIQDYAWEAFKSHGKRIYDEVRHEAQGIFVGYYFKDQFGEFVVATNYEEGNGNSQSAYVEMSEECLAKISEKCQNDGTLMLIWVHTHPNFGVFYSSTDYNCLKTNFYKPYQIGIVVDIKKEQHKGFKTKGSDVVEFSDYALFNDEKNILFPLYESYKIEIVRKNDGRINELTEEVKRLKFDLQSKTTDINQLQKTLQSKISGTKEIKEKLQNKEKNIECLNSDLQARTTDINQLQKKLQSKEKENEELKKNIQNKTAENERLKKDLQSKTKRETKKMSLIQGFFISCSGVDKEIMKEYFTEWNKYVSIGATIFFTGILASLSGGYAFYIIFRNTNIDVVDTKALLGAIFLGLLWGIIIFTLDRFIVSTYKKLDNKSTWKRLGNELFQTLPRVILAIIIAIVISKPITIKIFENQLSELIQSKSINFPNNFITKINALGDLTANNTHMWWTSLIITLFFIIIGLTPILIKLITKRGVYDEILDRIEYENMIEQKLKISHKNSEINKQL